LFAILCLALACNQRPPASDVITVAVLSSPNNLDPRIGSDETSQRVHQLVFDNLLALASPAVSPRTGSNRTR
jgi:hypothetical protein